MCIHLIIIQVYNMSVYSMYHIAAVQVYNNEFHVFFLLIAITVCKRTVGLALHQSVRYFRDDVASL